MLETLLVQVIATLNQVLVVVPGTTTNTWFSVAITCTNSVSSITVSGGAALVAPTTTNVVPYYESFETIGLNNRLPNCSWFAPSQGVGAKTYSSATTGNLLPNTGVAFAAFAAATVGADYYYTNGI